MSHNVYQIRYLFTDNSNGNITVNYTKRYIKYTSIERIITDFITWKQFQHLNYKLQLCYGLFLIGEYDSETKMSTLLDEEMRIY